MSMVGIHNIFEKVKKQRKLTLRKSKTPKKNYPPRYEECRDSGIVMFSTYTGAATAAAKKGVINFDAAFRVAMASVDELAQVGTT